MPLDGIALQYPMDASAPPVIDWRTVITWQGWWAELVSIVGGFTIWIDGSGNNRNFSQNGALQPAVGGAGFNGKPWFQFSYTGAGTYFNNAAILSDVVHAASGYCISAVNVTTIHSAGFGYIDDCILSDGTNDYFAMAFDKRQTDNSAGPPPSFRGYIWDGAEQDCNSIFDTGVVKIIEQWWTAGIMTTRVNGGAETHQPFAGIQVVTNALCAGKFVDGGSAAIAVTNVVPSSSDRNKICASMMLEFGAT